MIGFVKMLTITGIAKLKLLFTIYLHFSIESLKKNIV